MRTAHKCLLPCLTALAILALTAPDVSAQTPVELEHEGGAHCNSSNPCEVDIHGESHVSVLTFIVSQCVDEMFLEFGEDGTGHIVGGTLLDHPAGFDCTRVPCNGRGERLQEVEWDILNTVEVAPNEVLMTIAMCLDAVGDPDGTGAHCNFTMHMSEAPGTHAYLFGANFQCPNSIRIEGNWNAEGSPIEVEHS
ncbi:MAG TPA: hypothetical protein VHF90_03785 [Thermoleophilaceae bacterium]|nr:hypothetical protein [Thermoleophilaceae bacterium]